jgi:hypothetical protein
MFVMISSVRQGPGFGLPQLRRHLNCDGVPLEQQF